MLHWRWKQPYADSQADLPEVLQDYSMANAYPTQHYADAVCVCGSKIFRLSLDDGAGAAVRQCSTCGVTHEIGDSGEYLAEATLDECECVCGGDTFEITVGVSLYSRGSDVKWLYIGCRCPVCGLSGCYGDWKNEYDDYKRLLALV